MLKPFLFGAALLSATAITTIPLSAQDRGRGDTMGITSNQVVDMADARIAQLKADLRLTPDQDKNWGSFQNALHDMAQRRGDRMNKMREQRSAATTDANAPAPGTAPGTTPATDPAVRPRDDRDMRADRDRDRDRRDSRADRDRAPDIAADMRRQADELAAKADDFRKFADASGPLYTSLDDSQKGRFLAFTQRNMMEDPMQGERRGRGRDRY